MSLTLISKINKKFHHDNKDLSHSSAFEDFNPYVSRTIRFPSPFFGILGTIRKSLLDYCH